MTGIQARSVISVLSPYALTTVYNVRAALGIPKTKLDDDLAYRFERLINAASSSIESFCDREFVSRIKEEIYDGRPTDRFVPIQWPITEIIELWLDPTQKFTDAARYLLPSSQYAIVDNQSTIQLLSRQFPASRHSVKFKYKVGYAAVPADIGLATDFYVEWLYRFTEREDIGRSSRSKGDESVSIDQGMPQIVKDLIYKYKRFEFSGATPRSSLNV